MKNKVEEYKDYILKYNTSKFSSGLEWFTELLSINHRRELRVYDLYKKSVNQNLLIPKVFEINSKYIKIEKIIKCHDTKVNISNLIQNIKEFNELGFHAKISIFDYLSSPTFSIIRGIITNFNFLGIKIFIQTFKHLYLFYINKPKTYKTSLIHRDLKINQNMIPAKRGIYFIDFGSSILTKYYFLADIVELSTNHEVISVDFEIINKFIKQLEFSKFAIQYLRSQIFLLLLRRYLHLHPIDRADNLKKIKIKNFLNNLENIISKFRA